MTASPAMVSNAPSLAPPVEDVLGWKGCGWDDRPVSRQQWDQELLAYRNANRARLGAVGLFCVVLMFDIWFYGSHQVKDGFGIFAGLMLMLGQGMMMLGAWLDQRKKYRRWKCVSPTSVQMEAWRHHWASRNYLDIINETDVPFLAGDEQRLNALSPLPSVARKERSEVPVALEANVGPVLDRSTMSYVGSRVDPLGWKTQGWADRPPTYKEWEEDRSRLRQVFGFNVLGFLVSVAGLIFNGWMLLNYTYQPMDKGLWAASSAVLLYLLVTSVVRLRTQLEKDWVYQLAEPISVPKTLESAEAQSYLAAIALTSVPFLAGDRSRVLDLMKNTQGKAG